MLGLHWGYISRKFNIPQDSSMQVSFTILLDGFNSSTSSNPFLSTNIDFKLSVLNGSGLTMDSVSLKDLNPTNLEWRSYEATFRKTSSFSDPWNVEFGLFKGSDEQNLILSNVSVSWQPLIGSNISREQIPDFTTTTATTTTKSTTTTTTIVNNVTTNENDMNGTTVKYPPDIIDETNSTSSVLSANTTTPSNSSTTLPTTTTTSPKPTTTALYNLTTSQSVDNFTESSGNGTQESIVESKDDEGSIGYAGEVVLIVFIVLLGIMVLVVVAKYYHLQKNIGDYRVNPSAEYPNPSFNPQDSYRDH
ncbi:exocyst complex component 5 isoform X2 [Eurytemora carolleeae]|nr:exocyst complex component 5 isoform X2 [Eurytemora carolleeae]|eukprot:XP_023324746.1 exocyst complex component 5-like isoform X2 [Eurytemora affinis]